MLDSKYHIVTPAPKPKVKVALYAFKTGLGNWRITTEFYPNDDQYKYNHISNPEFKRLDWSEMEVEG